MKIVHLSTNERSAGAARATYRLHKALIREELQSTLLTMNGDSDDQTVARVSSRFTRLRNDLARRLDRLPLTFVGARSQPEWTTGQISLWRLHNHPIVREADIIGLYWVGDGFLANDEIGRLLNLGKPVVWRLSDMWPFTGGCHYSCGCDGYRTACDRCPQLPSSGQGIAARTLQAKLAWNSINLTVVCPSRWIYECACRSRVFEHARIEHIPTGIDTDIFAPVPREIARRTLGLPLNKKLVLFGAANPLDNPRKGSQHLIGAMRVLGHLAQDIELVIFGSARAPKEITDQFPVHCIGKITDDAALVLVYSACDIFVAPSVEENLPNTVIESMACGTPAIAFRIGGMPDLITHNRNGYLVDPFNANDMAAGIIELIRLREAGSISAAARETIETKFNQRIVAKSYKQLYEGLLQSVRP